MELAASGFNSSIFSRLGSVLDQGKSADRQNETRQNPTNKVSSSSTRSSNGRVILGEVVDRQVETIYPDPNAANQSRSFTGQPENRRVSPQQAIQIFQQNEAIPANDAQSRQVSGIIDIYV